MEQQTKNDKKTWGGKREGAGRKATTAKTYGFNAPQEVVEILEKQQRKTDFINKAIIFYAQHLQEQ